jgi:hypothetical protein
LVVGTGVSAEVATAEVAKVQELARQLKSRIVGDRKSGGSRVC